MHCTIKAKIPLTGIFLIRLWKIGRKIKPTIFRSSMKNSNKNLEIGESANFVHSNPLKLVKIRWVEIFFDENVWFELLSMLFEK
jgi:hypothetical protein